MPVQKNHEHLAKPTNTEAFDRSPVCFNVKPGVREKLRAVPDWREKLRAYVDLLIAESVE